MEVTEIKYFVEAALLAAGRPLSIDQLQGLFKDRSKPDKSQIREAIKALQDDYEPRGIEVAEVASGFRMQVKTKMADRLERLWEERPPRYSRALFETLALIAYRQPMTRGEIEEVRGVAVSTNIMRSLLEREWIRVVGHRDVPGRPAMFGTTRLFLDYFGLKKLEDLPPLADLSDWESLRVQLNLPEVEYEVNEALPASGDADRELGDEVVGDIGDELDDDTDGGPQRTAVIMPLPVAPREARPDSATAAVDAAGAAEAPEASSPSEDDDNADTGDTSASNG
ncbi:MAG: SMC-Scp complex subunit ScpB [Woeseia sp.]|nr:SMC-Scp complex subunit ScpB [Woeseia sp.]